MKIIWEPSDIRPGRRVVQKNNEQLIITYDALVSSPNDALWGTVSLVDGATHLRYVTNVELAEWLTANELQPRVQHA